MNDSKLKRFINLLFAILIGVTGVAQDVNFDEERVDLLLDYVIENFDFKINFDPELLSEYTYSGRLSVAKEEEFFKELFAELPFSYKAQNDQFLIFLRDKRIFKIKGIAISVETSKALGFVAIQLEGTNEFFNTDEKGAFEFEISGFDYQKLIFSHITADDEVFPLSDFDQNQSVDIKMTSRVRMIKDAIVIEGYLLPGIEEGNSYVSTKLRLAELAENYSSREYDVLSRLQILPGITSIDETATNLNIRGSLPDQNLITWEGVTMYHTGHLFGMVSSFNPFTIGEVEVFKTSYDVEHEDRTGGAVDVSLTDTVIDSISGSAGISLTEIQLNTNIPLVKEKLAIVFGVRKSTNSWFKSPTLKSYSNKLFRSKIIGEEEASSEVGFILNEGALDYYDLNAKIIFKPTKSIYWESSAFSSTDDFDYLSLAASESVAGKESVLLKTHALTSSLHKEWNEKSSSEIQVSSSFHKAKGETVFNTSSESETSNLVVASNRIRDYTLKFLNNFKLKPELNLLVGYSFSLKDLKYFSSLSQESESESEEGNLANGKFHHFLQSVDFKKNGFSVQGGLRSTYSKSIGKWYFSPRASGQLKINQSLKLKASAGLMYQFVNQLINIGNTTVNSNVRSWVLSSNEQGRAMDSKKFAAGLLFLKNKWMVDVEYYNHLTSGIPVVSTTLNSDLKIEGTGTSNSYGIDVLLEKKWKRLKTWANYSYSENKYKFPQLGISSFPANNEIKHNLNVTSAYSFSKWQFSLSTRFHTGTPISVPVGIDQYSSENQVTLERLSFSTINGARTEKYNSIDLGVSYKTSLAKSKLKLEINGTLLNVLNSASMLAEDYFVGDTEANNSRIVSIQKFQLERTPQLLVRLMW